MSFLQRASFIGFTGTPIERKDVNTRAVFGDYIDILRHQADGWASDSLISTSASVAFVQ